MESSRKFIDAIEGIENMIYRWGKMLKKMRKQIKENKILSDEFYRLNRCHNDLMRLRRKLLN